MERSVRKSPAPKKDVVVEKKEEDLKIGIGHAFRTAFTRLVWLSGLLLLQSLSSIILEAHAELIRDHIVITLFLTMLVGAGGNSGAQAAVSVIRGIAVKTITRKNIGHVMLQESLIGLLLSTGLFFIGFVRVILTRGETLFDSESIREAFVIGVALWVIVVVAVATGAALPLLFHFALGIDSAHSGSSVQVFMDVFGVLITCNIAMIGFSK